MPQYTINSQKKPQKQQPVQSTRSDHQMTYTSSHKTKLQQQTRKKISKMAFELLEPREFSNQLSGSSGLSLLHLNIRSLQRHYDEFVDLRATLHHTFHFIALSETWLSENTCQAYPLPGYHLELACRRSLSSTKGSQTVHGGVALYVRNDEI